MTRSSKNQYKKQGLQGGEISRPFFIGQLIDSSAEIISMKRITPPLTVFALLLAMYLWTLAPGNFWVDSAAFAACNEILGLPHAPSFPLYTIIGRLMHVFLPVAPAQASNLYSAITSAFAGVVIYGIIHVLLVRLFAAKKLHRLIAACGAVFIGLTLPVWQSSVRAEVYSLQVLLLSLVIYSLVRGWFDRDTGGIKFTFLAVFLQGLAFTNHSLLAISTLPLTAIGVLAHVPNIKSITGVLRSIVPAVVLFAVALSVYVYLPVRANQDPAINSGQPKTLTGAFQSITRSGEDYLPTGQTSKPDYLDRTRNLAVFLFDQTGGLVIVGVIFAILAGLKRQNRILLLLFGSSLLGFIITIWAADFRLYNFDIVAYAAVPLLLLLICAFTGLYEACRLLEQKTQLVRYAPLVFILMAFFEFYGNLYAADLSATEGPDILAEAILRDAPDNAMLFVNEDDVALPLWYHQYALGKRPDITVISAGALYRPDYRNQVRHKNPGLRVPSGFEQRKITDLSRLVDGIRSSNPERPVQVQFGTPGFAVKNLYPDGFLYRYTEEDSLPMPSAERIVELYADIAGTATDLLTHEFLGRNAFNNGVYFDRIGMGDKAYLFFQYAIEIDDTNPDYLLRLGIAFLDAGKTEDARALLKQATETGSGCPEAEDILQRLEARKFSKR